MHILFWFLYFSLFHSKLYITLIPVYFKVLCVFIFIFILHFVYTLETDTTLSYDKTGHTMHPG